MASLLEIKNKISATKSTKKITKAMQLVAASKMKTFQRTAVSVRVYTKKLVEALALGGGELNETSFAEVRSEGKTLFLILTSDKGLCGAMNARLIRTLFKSTAWNETPEADRLLITVGRKSRDAARAMGVPVEEAFNGLPEQMTPVDALQVVSAVMTRWNEKQVKRVILVSPEYINPFLFNIREREYLPLRAERVKEMVGNGTNEEILEAAFFEPGQEEVVHALAGAVVEGLFLEAFYELKATEYSSRMVAMKKATEASDEKITHLTNAFNKARQGAITQQLSELAAANEAMSSETMYESFEI